MVNGGQKGPITNIDPIYINVFLSVHKRHFCEDYVVYKLFYLNHQLKSVVGRSWKGKFEGSFTIWYVKDIKIC